MILNDIKFTVYLKLLSTAKSNVVINSAIIFCVSGKVGVMSICWKR